MAKSPKLYGIYDDDTNLVFCGDAEDCYKFLGLKNKNSFFKTVTTMKQDSKVRTRNGYRIEIVGKLKDFEVEE